MTMATDSYTSLEVIVIRLITCTYAIALLPSCVLDELVSVLISALASPDVVPIDMYI